MVHTVAISDSSYRDRFWFFINEVCGLPEEALSFEKTAYLINKHFYIG